MRKIVYKDIISIKRLKVETIDIKFNLQTRKLPYFRIINNFIRPRKV